MAYLDTTGSHDDILLKGNATFTYSSTNPTLHLDYDNYYSFDMSPMATGTGTTVTASGTNNTGDSYYDVPTITKNCSKAYAYYNAEYLQKGNIQEAVGTYQITFGTVNGYHFGDSETNDFYLRGAFGGTKQ